MTRWEYKSFQVGYVHNGVVRPHQLEEVLNGLEELGAEGWELAAVYGMMAYLKRPKVSCSPSNPLRGSGPFPPPQMAHLS